MGYKAVNWGKDAPVGWNNRGAALMWEQVWHLKEQVEASVEGEYTWEEREVGDKTEMGKAGPCRAS